MKRSKKPLAKRQSEEKHRLSENRANRASAMMARDYDEPYVKGKKGKPSRRQEPELLSAKNRKKRTQGKLD